MTFDEFKILCKGMKAVYTSERFLPDGDSIRIWFQLLGDLDYKAANAAIQKYILTNKFPPTIADIRELSAAVQNGEMPDWGDGWEQVLKAISRFGSYRIPEAMESFDPITRQAVERIGFRNICMSENINTDRANFRMIFEQIASRKKNDSQIPEKLKLTIDTIRQQNPMLLWEKDE